MTRVAFVFEGPSFLGSVNYFRNLFSALALLPDRKLAPLVFVGTLTPEKMLGNFRHAQIVRTALLDERSFAGRVRRRLKRLLGNRDPLLRMLLARHRVQVLSHSGPLPGSNVKTVAWIPDFQHVSLPAFFSDQERALRDEAFRAMARDCDCVVLSSDSAQRDLAAFAPSAAGKSRVLRFVPEVDASAAVMSLSALQEKYKFHAPYFYIPNQFWIHKNHTLVVDALVELQGQGVRPTVLMTGSTDDYRHPNHFADLMQRVESCGLADSFKVLGLVPYEDLLSLMHHSLAIINPSLFEGWSSTVEEAKALDKAILLSNLPVHLEQNPAKGVFFDPADAHDLAVKMHAALTNADPDGLAAGPIAYSDSYRSDRLRFAAKYEEIVLKLVGAG